MKKEIKKGINAPITIVEINTRDNVVDNNISLFNSDLLTIDIDNPKAIAPLIVPEQLQIPRSTKLNLKFDTWNKSISIHIPKTETNLPHITTHNSKNIKLQLKATWK